MWRPRWNAAVRAPPPPGALTPPDVKAQLAACAGAGLLAIPNTCEGPTGPKSTCVGMASPALLGYQMADEPSVPAFPALAAWAASVSARSPGALRFINLLPNYASNGALGADSYADYLSQFIATVKPDILSFDHYPVFGPGSATATDDNATMAGYIRNLAAVRAASQAAGIGFWNFFNAMPFNGRSDVTEAQMAWQAFTSLAFGSKGLM